MIKTSILALFSLLFMIFHAGLVTKGAAAGLLLWYSAVVPALFPFMVLSSILSASGGISWLCSRLRWFSVSAGCQQTDGMFSSQGSSAAALWAQKRAQTFSRKGGSAPARQSFSSPSVITRVPCFSQVSFIPCLPLSYRFCALSLPFTCRSCCSLSRHTSFITLLLVLNPSRKIPVFPNNIQLRIPPMRFLQSTHDQINRPVLHFPWMPRS